MNPDKKTKTELWYERARKVMPGRQSNFRSERVEPLFLTKAEGVHYTDVDGKDYIDFVLGMGPAIWGHSNPEYIQAIKDQMDTLFSTGSAVAHTTMEVELAEKIVDHVPCAEWVRFCISGSEADQLAMRLARAYTGRPLFLRFEGHHHGWLDNVFGGRINDNPDATPYAVKGSSDSAELSSNAYSDSLCIPWNDADALEETLQKYGDQIAMVLMEAIMCNNGYCPPKPGYLEKVRALCTTYGVVLCFDEVITGFRVDMGGAQGKYGVTPDLAVFGKAMAGGLPLSAVAGKKEILSLLKESVVTGGGTFNSFPLSMAAGLISMKLLKRNNYAAFKKVDHNQKSFVDELKSLAHQHGHPILIQGPRGMVYIDFIDLDIAFTPDDFMNSDKDKQGKFRYEMVQEGILIGGGSRLVISAALTENDIDRTLDSANKVFKRI